MPWETCEVRSEVLAAARECLRRLAPHECRSTRSPRQCYCMYCDLLSADGKARPGLKLFKQLARDHACNMAAFTVRHARSLADGGCQLECMWDQYHSSDAMYLMLLLWMDDMTNTCPLASLTSSAGLTGQKTFSTCTVDTSLVSMHLAMLFDF